MTRLIKSLKTTFVSFLAVALLMLVAVSPVNAASLPTQAEVRANFDQFAQQAQKNFEKQVKATRSTLKKLPGDLEKAVAGSDAAKRQNILNNLKEAQEQLEETAKSYEQYAKEADEYEQELTRVAEQSRDEMKVALQQKVQNVKDSLGLTSDAINVLSDDTAKALKDTSDFSKARFLEHADALQKALNNSQEAFKALTR
jgi:hypothetical protein